MINFNRVAKFFSCVSLPFLLYSDAFAKDVEGFAGGGVSVVNTTFRFDETLLAPTFSAYGGASFFSDSFITLRLYAQFEVGATGEDINMMITNSFFGNADITFNILRGSNWRLGIFGGAGIGYTNYLEETYLVSRTPQSGYTWNRDAMAYAKEGEYDLSYGYSGAAYQLMAGLSYVNKSGFGISFMGIYRKTDVLYFSDNRRNIKESERQNKPAIRDSYLTFAIMATYNF